MSFHEIRLPEFVEHFIVGRPEFSTSSAKTVSGREMRVIDRDRALQKYIIHNCVLSERQFEVFNGFFRSRKGQRFSFRIRDYADYIVTSQLIAYGDDNRTEFQLFKLYEDAYAPYKRFINKPVYGSVKLYIENQGVEADINYKNGKINLPYSLEKGLSLSASFHFDVQVRFSADSFSYFYLKNNAIQLNDIELQEVTE